MKKWFRFLFLLTLLVASFSYAMFQGGFVSWFLFASFLPLACYAILLYFYPMKRLTIQRTFDQSEYIAGDTATVTLTISRPNRFPLFYLLIQDVVKGNKSASCSRVVFPLFQKELTVTYKIEQMSRGE